ncbi:ABC transporter substrate-binding protein [Cytobacillus sp. Hz8]|uniref:ABC transporter substrate-binding protein n=1 Tax=Cytobacillus sp. Hz8 TaxID=3347168 RepID=UPI0035E11C63
MKYKGILPIAVILLLFLASCSSKNVSQQKELKKVIVANWSQPISEQTNLLVDEKKHFFQDRGLTIDLIPGEGGGDAIKNILSGKADIAFTDPGSVYFAMNQGAKLKIIYNIYPQNVFNIVSLKKNHITRPEDLKGKRIGVYSLTSGTRQNLLVLLNQVGLSEKDVKIVETGLLNFAPLMQGQVDATAATDTGLVTAREKGLGMVNVLNVKDYLNLPSDVFVVTEKTYNEKKKLLKKFIEAYQKSAEWMIQQPEEAAKLAKQYAIDGKDEKRNLEIIQIRNESSISDVTKKEGLGALDSLLLQKGADTYMELGLIQKKINMKNAVTDEFLPTPN